MAGSILATPSHVRSNNIASAGSSAAIVMRGSSPVSFADYYDPAQGRLRLVASPDAADGSLAIQQDTRIFLATLAAGDAVEHALAPGRYGWLQVLRGRVTVNGTPADTSDGVAIGEERRIAIAADAPAEVMLFDLA